VDGESKAIYWRMAAAFARFISPDDFIAWMLVKDLADYRLEIHRLRRYKALLITEAWRRRVREQIASWEARIEGDPAKLAAEAEQVKKHFEKSGKAPEEVKKLISGVEAKVEVDCREAKQRAHQQVELWKMSEVTEQAVAVEFKGWLPSQDALEPLLERAERKFNEKLAELERHLRGFANLIWEAATIEGVVVEAKAVVPSTEPQRLEQSVAEPRPTEPATNPADDPPSESAVTRAVRKWWGRAA
jgi:hypothetical protein